MHVATLFSITGLYPKGCMPLFFQNHQGGGHHTCNMHHTLGGPCAIQSVLCDHMLGITPPSTANHIQHSYCNPTIFSHITTRGVCLVLGGVCLVPRGGLPDQGGLPDPGECLPGPGGYGIPACTEADTPSPPVDRHTPVKTLPWPQLRYGR